MAWAVALLIYAVYIKADYSIFAQSRDSNPGRVARNSDRNSVVSLRVFLLVENGLGGGTAFTSGLSSLYLIRVYQAQS